MDGREQARREALARRRAEASRHRLLQGIGHAGKPEGGWSQNLDREGCDIFGAPLEETSCGTRGGEEDGGHGHRVDRPEIPSAVPPPQTTILDIETTGRTPWLGRLLCVGIGDEALRPLEGYSVAARVLSEPGVVVCHTSYDLRWLGLAGLRLGPDTDFHDTRVMAWLLDENRSLALDDLCETHLGRRPQKLISSVANVLMFELRDGSKVPLDEAPWDELAAYNMSDLAATSELYVELAGLLQDAGLWELFLRDEVPLARALLGVEVVGLPFDEGNRVKLQERVHEDRDKLKADLLREGGLPDTFNLASTKQVGEYLFKQTAVLKDRIEMTPEMAEVAKRAKRDGGPSPAEALDESGLLPAGFWADRVGRLFVHGAWRVPGRRLKEAEAGFGSSAHWKERGKKKRSPSTGSVSLVLSNPDDAWVADFVFWRELSKLDSSFLSRFPTYTHAGRLHGTINRTGTATGRFSSSEPNLQQIPAHGAYGAHVRALFSGDLVVGDYAQLEQRVAAHFSLDENLLKAYRDDIDLYGLAASTLFGGEPSKDHKHRGLMKTGMLALQYGAGAGKLAQLILIDDQNASFTAGSSVSTRAGASGAVTDEMKEKAQVLIDQLHSVFPRFFEWRLEVIERAARDGYVETLGGRRRRLEFPERWLELKAKPRGLDRLPREVVREGFMMERQAVNAVCQGSAADVVARAIVASNRRLRPEQATLLLQVHDEILWAREAEWDGGCLAVVREVCESGHGFELNVPLSFDVKEVGSWAEKGGSITNVHNLFSERMKRNRSEGLQSRKAGDLSRARRDAGDGPGRHHAGRTERS